MGFPTNKQSPNGLSKTFGNPIPEDDNSNSKGPTPKRIAPISGRLKVYKTSVASLNTGESSRVDKNNLSERDDA